MNKRIIYLLFSILLLFAVFYFSEDRIENQTEINFWKENWRSILFYPPGKEWCGQKEPAFLENSIQMNLYDRGWKNSPLFSVSSKDEVTGEDIVYEGNYNVKNTFSDLSTLKTKFIESGKEEDLKKFCVTSEAPKLALSAEIISNTKTPPEKEIYFGIKLESDSSRIIARIENKIVSPYLYLLEKFRGKIVSLRERQFITFNGGYIESINFHGQGLGITVENRAKKNQYDSFVNQWSRTTGERIVLSPEIGNDWENKLKSMRADLYPDDENGPGFAETKKWKEATPEFTILVSHSDRIRWKLLVYPKWVWKDKVYRPILRELAPYFTENVSYLEEETFQNFLQAGLRVKNASRFERPNQKIQ